MIKLKHTSRFSYCTLAGLSILLSLAGMVAPFFFWRGWAELGLSLLWMVIAAVVSGIVTAMLLNSAHEDVQGMVGAMALFGTAGLTLIVWGLYPNMKIGLPFYEVGLPLCALATPFLIWLFAYVFSYRINKIVAQDDEAVHAEFRKLELKGDGLAAFRDLATEFRNELNERYCDDGLMRYISDPEVKMHEHPLVEEGRETLAFADGGRHVYKQKVRSPYFKFETVVRSRGESLELEFHCESGGLVWIRNKNPQKGSEWKKFQEKAAAVEYLDSVMRG